MNAGVGMTSVADPGRGLGAKQIIIRSVDAGDDLVLGTDPNGAEIQVPYRIRRTGLFPQVGQTWIVDRALGFWSLAALVGAPDAWQALTPASGASGDPVLTPQGIVTGDGAVRFTVLRGQLLGSYWEDGHVLATLPAALAPVRLHTQAVMTLSLPVTAGLLAVYGDGRLRLWTNGALAGSTGIALDLGGVRVSLDP